MTAAITVTEERLAIMNDEMGVWRCRTAFNCVEACPRDIDITKAIAEVKMRWSPDRCRGDPCGCPFGGRRKTCPYPTFQMQRNIQKAEK